ncbi:hypothetical protein ACFQX7_03860 [Luedemannella flava]
MAREVGGFAPSRASGGRWGECVRGRGDRDQGGQAAGRQVDLDVGDLVAEVAVERLARVDHSRTFGDVGGREDLDRVVDQGQHRVVEAGHGEGADVV